MGFSPLKRVPEISPVYEGKYLQAYCKSRTSDAISALNSLRPNDALLLLPSGWAGTSKDLEKSETISRTEPLPFSLGRNVAKIPVDHLEIEDIVRVPTGSSPPADGIIMPDHEGLLDESSLTGESRLIKKFPGDMVFVGTINKGPVLHVKVANIGKKTMWVALPSLLAYLIILFLGWIKLFRLSERPRLEERLSSGSQTE